MRAASAARVMRALCARPPHRDSGVIDAHAARYSRLRAPISRYADAALSQRRAYAFIDTPSTNPDMPILK